MYDNMVEFVLLNDDEQELWEIDYEKKIAFLLVSIIYYN
jgi:hypothetical protein